MANVPFSCSCAPFAASLRGGRVWSPRRPEAGGRLWTLTRLGRASARVILRTDILHLQDTTRSGIEQNVVHTTQKVVFMRWGHQVA
jgi:hypothetical protein